MSGFWAWLGALPRIGSKVYRRAHMKQSDILFISYGALLVLLGGVGWVMAHSLPSLLAGSGSGLALMISGVIWRSGKRAGLYAAVGLLVMLCGMFGWRYLVQGKTLSLVLFCTSAFALVQGARVVRLTNQP